MRLHRLSVTAFGPFSATEEIDFDALSDAGLFLIQGQTGAGKTSVLDAVCFALYGQVPGARRAVKGLRSDHAADDSGPRVELEATIRGRRLRIVRSPAWERPKLRGQGTTSEKAKVLLEEREHGEWVALSTRLDEVGDLVGGLLGMTVDQFCTVAMLPQGDFASFLRATADDRRKVLERLFAAEVFTHVENWLADRRAATGRTAADLAAHAESLAGRVAETTRAALPPGTGQVPQPRRGDTPDATDTSHVDVLPAWAAELAGHHDAIRAGAEELLGTIEAELDAARAALATARDLTERQSRHAAAQRRRQALAERAEERLTLNSRLYAAERADRVLAYANTVNARTRRAEQARDEAARARARIGGLVAPGAAEDVLQKAERARRDEIAALDAKRGTAERLVAVEGELARLEAERPDLEQREARIEATLADLPGHVAEYQQALDAARVDAARRPGAEAAVDDVQRRVRDADQRDHAIARLAEAEAILRERIDAAQSARDRLQSVRQARLDGMAATLAGDLRSGEPCRVCGSPEHPHPAEPPGPIPGEDDESRAQAEDEHAQSLREEATGKVESLRAARDAMLESVGASTGDELAAELQSAEATRAESIAAEGRVEEFQARLHRAEQALDDARGQRDGTAQELTANRIRTGELTDECARLSAELDAARGDDASLEERRDRLAREADALATAVHCLKEAERTATELGEARTEADRAAAEQGFGTLDEARAAALEDEDQGALRDEIRSFDDEEAWIKAALADPDVSTAAGSPAPDLTALQASVDVAEASHRAAVSAADSARRRCERLTELRRELAAAVTEWRPAAERHRVAARLAGLTSGKSSANRRSMSLSAYVLAARLEQVVAAANERLAHMSADRYVLEHTTDKAAGDRTRGAAGLGLRVVDGWTGRARDPVTLSGGESFITSLALALGLADVVTAEAGGTEISTLFVDEGFGTLDEETLDEVMDVLDGLRDGGRAVGIVSHVAELRTRIPTQLRLTKTRTGSTTRVQLA